MRFTTVLAAGVAALPFASADFIYGVISYSITTATGKIRQLVPTTENTCEKAYDFYPKGPYGFADVVSFQTSICGRELVFNTTSGAWYNHGRQLYSGNCTAIENPVRQSCVIGYNSGAYWDQAWYCATPDVCP